MDRLTNAWPLLRDVAIVVTALVLIIWEAVFRNGPERPTLLLLYTGMLGLPAFLRADSRLNGKKDGQPTPNDQEVAG